jgi:hypothetical protein
VVAQFFLPTKTPVQIKRKKAWLEARESSCKVQEVKINIKMEEPMPKKVKVTEASDPTYQAHVQSLPNPIVDESPAVEEVEEEPTPLFVEDELDELPSFHQAIPEPTLKDHWYNKVVERGVNGWAMEQGTRGAVKNIETPLANIDKVMNAVVNFCNENPNTRSMYGIESGNEDQLSEDVKRAICEKYGVEFCPST